MAYASSSYTNPGNQNLKTPTFYSSAVAVKSVVAGGLFATAGSLWDLKERTSEIKEQYDRFVSMGTENAQKVKSMPDNALRNLSEFKKFVLKNANGEYKSTNKILLKNSALAVLFASVCYLFLSNKDKR